MILQMLFGLSPRFGNQSLTGLCLMLLLATVSPLFNSATTEAQSTIVQSHTSANVTFSRQDSIANSISSAQVATEAFLSKSVASIGVIQDQNMTARNVFELLGVTVFIDINLDGVFDEDLELRLKTGVSIFRSLSRALLEYDSVLMVEPDGSILIMSIDDEMEPNYLRNIVYDVTNIAGSTRQAESLANTLMNTIDSDSWEMNGGGNSTVSIFEQNGHVLMTINQSYATHLEIRSHLRSVFRLTGRNITATSGSQRRYEAVRSNPSNVVETPSRNQKFSLGSSPKNRKPRGFGSSGLKGGGLF